MKKGIVLFATAVFLLLSITSSTVIKYPLANAVSFKSGERLVYRISYGIMDAGEAVLTVNETSKKGANNRPLYHVKGEGKTLGAFNWFYEVHDVYESYIDKEGAFPWYFVRRVDEGGYKINQDYTFKQDKQVVNTGKKEFDVPMGVQDMISSFYYARTLDFENMKPGDETEFKCFMDDEIYPLRLRFVAYEILTIRKGKFRCMKFVPVVQEGRYFENDDDVEFWVTNDKNRIPVLVKAKIPVGSIRMHLVEWSGLKAPLAKLD